MPTRFRKSQIPQLLDEMNKIGRKSWLVIRCDIVDFDVVRRDLETNSPLASSWGDNTPPTSMKRFRFMVDGFTFIDAEVLPTGTLRILSNTCRGEEYNEASAFEFKWFQRGKKVGWHRFVRHLEAFVEMSVKRVQGARCEYHPCKNRIDVFIGVVKKVV